MPSDAQKWRVAFLTNLIPPYHQPLFALLSRQFSRFRLLISTPMESNRPWQPDWSGLDVVVQNGISFSLTWRHPRFGESIAVHFPTDTIWQLWHFRPHAVISVEMGFRTLLAYGYRRLRPGCRLLIWSEVTAITEQGRGSSRQWLRRFLATRADAFLAVGGAGVRYIETLGVPCQKIFQIAYSTRLEPFLAIPLERSQSSARRLLFSGQLIERKGLLPFLETLIRWAESHPDSPVEFTLVGDGPLRSTLSLVPLPANVKLLFIGTLPYHQLPDTYAASGIFVLPTLADTWAVVINEALASGLPVLGSVYSQAVQEMVEDGCNGWTFRPDQKSQMQDALNRALAVPDADLAGMRQAARQRACQVTPQTTAEICQEAVRQCFEQAD